MGILERGNLNNRIKRYLYPTNPIKSGTNLTKFLLNKAAAQHGSKW